MKSLKTPNKLNQLKGPVEKRGGIELESLLLLVVLPEQVLLEEGACPFVVLQHLLLAPEGRGVMVWGGKEW